MKWTVEVEVAEDHPEITKQILEDLIQNAIEIGLDVEADVHVEEV